jgi:hypothetical protein
LLFLGFLDQSLDGRKLAKKGFFHNIPLNRFGKMLI